MVTSRAFILGVMAVFILMGGYHNIDLAFNLSVNSGCIDYNGIIYQDRNTLYFNGLRMVFFGFFLSLLIIYDLLSVNHVIHKQK